MVINQNGRYRLDSGLLLSGAVMTPALALFYGAWSAGKNVLSTTDLGYIFRP